MKDFVEQAGAPREQRPLVADARLVNATREMRTGEWLGTTKPRRGSFSLGSRRAKATWSPIKDDMVEAVPVIRDDLRSIRDGVAAATANLDNKSLDDRAGERRELLGRKLAESLRDHPVSCEKIGYSSDTVKRILKGKAHPTEKVLKQLLDRMSASEVPLSPERRSELEEGHRAAGDVPWLAGQRLAAASASMSTAATTLAATAARVEHLQRVIIDLETAVAAAAANSEEELRLRSELDQANTKLREALAQEHEDCKYLVRRATEMSHAVSAYLGHVNRWAATSRRSPMNRPRRRSARTPERCRRRREVAGRYRVNQSDRR